MTVEIALRAIAITNVASLLFQIVAVFLMMHYNENNRRISERHLYLRETEFNRDAMDYLKMKTYEK